MTYNPGSNIYLCDVPFTKNHSDVLDFTSREEQLAYFRNRINKEYYEYVYVKKDNMVKVEGNLEDLVQNNYIFYQNPTYKRWYYCFIDRMEYISENTTAIYFTTDAWQTWLFDIEFMPSFIERKHVTNDARGANTVPEGLETGEYICNEMFKLENTRENYCIVVGSTANLQSSSMENDFGGNYTGTYSGVGYYWYRMQNTAELASDLQKLANANKIEAVSSIFIAPTWLVHGYTSSQSKGKVDYTSDPQNLQTVQTDIVRNLNGYVPKNNKLFTYPYCYFMITNGVGGHAEFRPELCKDNYLKVNIEGTLTPSCSIHYTPLDYQGVADYFDGGISGGKLPQLNWSTDQFTNWITQNAVNLTTPDVQMGFTGLDMFSDLLHLDIGGAASRYANNYMAVKQRDKEVETHAKIPPQTAGNLNSGDIATTTLDNTLHVYTMTIKQEFARIIDDYFDKYGYQINRVETPKIRSRQNWNYLKTIGFNLKGNIPQNEMEEIKNMFDSGVTVWHNPNTIYDYNQNNGII